MLSLKLKLFTHIFRFYSFYCYPMSKMSSTHTNTCLIKIMVSSIATAREHYSCSILPAFSLSSMRGRLETLYLHVDRWDFLSSSCSNFRNAIQGGGGMGGVWKIPRSLKPKWKLNRQFGYKFATDEEEIKLFLSFHFIFNLTLKMFQFVLLWLVSRLEVGQSWMRCALSRNRNFECLRREFKEDDCHHLI